jgi:hypothetical protein
MRRFGLIAVTVVVAALTQATTGSAAVMLTHKGSHFFSRTTPKPCFARPMGPKFPRRLAMGCNCPRGNVVPKAPSATYRFAIPAGTHFTFQVAWGGNRKPRVTTTQAGPWSYIKVHGPRHCAVLSQVVSVTATPS